MPDADGRVAPAAAQHLLLRRTQGLGWLPDGALMERRAPLARKTPLRAKTPMKRTAIRKVSARPRKPKPPTKTQLKKKADTIFSKIVRARGVCQAKGVTITTLVETEPGNELSPVERVMFTDCSPALQCAHLAPRRYLSVRWDEDNASALCGAHHAFFTHFPLEFDLWVTSWMGPHAWMALKQRAIMGHGSPDYPAIIERLQRRAAEIGVKP